MPQRDLILDRNGSRIHPAIFRYSTRRGVRYIAVAMHDRKQRWQSGFLTIKAAEVWREETVVAMRRGQAGKAPARMTLSDFIEARWWPDVKPGLHSEASVSTYRDQIDHALKYLGDRRLVGLRSEDVQEFKTGMFEDGIGPAAMHFAFMRLRQALDHAVALEWLNVNPTSRIDAPPKPVHEAPILTLKQVERLLTLAEEDRRFGAIFTVVVFTGLRWGEISRMQWSEIDWAERRLSITKGKTLASRKPMWFGQVTVERLRVHMNEQQKWARDQGGTRPPLVFPGEDGEAMNYSWFNRNVWYPLRKRLGIPSMHFHDLRHVHATLLAQANVHPSVAQRRLRHATVAMTMDVYTSVSGEQQRDAVAAVEALFAGVNRGEN